ncbi:Two-component hybrid sensor and regulator [Arcticibacter svalbardensis MN12-7]|uniref:Two-component hybrid sensor and regulator n=2 Tax=Arcticibacter TaxID=1288026 RepID=R9GWL7_9SPHI|nr:Two-component hybrid sensor and regulator [Arcticibacter svalbardensis MN12-7]
MMMPEMDGYEAIAEIKSNKQISSVPIIAVTAQAMVGDREKCLEAGAEAYLSKPIDIDALLKVLEHYMKHDDRV